ncbi:MAG: methylenetetrahydrofolate reductase, partial [Desulfobacterales bacterium]|nr:methylenetetrahydrofolate reductase [Desulfobacterales bacterium]
MHARDIFESHKTTFSFEFFPPKTPASAESLFKAVKELEELKPTFVSVTYGAGGSTRELTHDLVLRIRKETKVTTVPHLTCVCHSEAEIESILQRYANEGVDNILALAGDPPANLEGYDRSKDAFQHAADL